MKHTFEESGLSSASINALKKMKINTPTPIQSEGIPLMQDGKDVVLEAQTGSGKTLAYLLPLYEQLDPALRTTQALVLVPTHELALQVQREAKKLTEYSKTALHSAIIMGNVNIKRQIEVLKDKPQIVIGTPGRILELIKKRKIAAHTVKTIIVDEADKMLDIHNVEGVKAVIKTTLRDRQLVFASASISKHTIQTIEELTDTAAHVKMKKEAAIPKTITHSYLVVDKRDKLDTLRKLLFAAKPNRAIIFTSQSDNIEVIYEKLKFQNFKVSYLYGGMKKAERAKQVQAFQSGKNNLLLASDVAGRGLHFDDIDYIIHLNICESSKDYIHRSGRTGRNGKAGNSICIATTRELAFIKKYENQLKITFAKQCLQKGKLILANTKKG